MLGKLRTGWRWLWYGLRNLWRFLPVVWRWRGWDYEHSYELFMVGLHYSALKIERDAIHAEWGRDVANMRKAQEMWCTYTEAHADWRKQEHEWNELHDHLKQNARSWWD